MANSISVAAGSNTVSVLLGRGDGTFQRHRDFVTGSSPTAVIARDVNHDGKLDLVTANSGADSVSVLLGKGDGTFKAHADFATGSQPVSVAAGDFNRDGKLDLATANFNNDNISILIGKGNGTFQPHVDYRTSNSPDFVAVGDLNGDHKDDVLATSAFASQISVLRGNGDGTLQSHVEYEVGANAAAIALGDFNGIGASGFAVANFASNSVSVYPSLPNIAVAPNRLNFGKQKIGTHSKARGVRLSNSGSVPLIISAVFKTGDYLQTNNCPVAPNPLAVGASCIFHVTFTPTKAGVRDGHLAIEDNASANPQTINLGGVGVAP